MQNCQFFGSTGTPAFQTFNESKCTVQPGNAPIWLFQRLESQCSPVLPKNLHWFADKQCKRTIWMSHLRHTMVDGSKFWISYQRLAFLSSFSRWQLIQNLAPSTIVWHQCDIWIGLKLRKQNSWAIIPGDQPSEIIM